MVFNLLSRPAKAAPSIPKSAEHFRFDAHLLTYAGSKLAGHEYMINITPQEFGARLTCLEEEYEVSVSYEQAGGLAAAASAIVDVDHLSTICSESLQQWRVRDPQTVAQLCGEAIDEIDDDDFALWRV